MGLKNFNSFLRATCPDVFEEIHISEYCYQRVAIDISLYLNKYKAIAGDAWLTAFVNLVTCLRRNELHCVFIFDGKSPPEKSDEKAKRRKGRETMEKQLYVLEEALESYHNTGEIAQCIIDLHAKRRSPTRLLKPNSSGIDMRWVERKIDQRRKQLYQINPEDYEKVKELFRILKVPFYTAPAEAEKFCAKLCLDKKVCAVLSEDTDVMAYGTPVFLTKIDTSRDTCVRIRYDYLLERLGLTPAQFLDFCIMCGTDYNNNIPKVGSKTAYKRIKLHGSIEGIEKETVFDVSVLNHIRVRQLFSEFEEYDISAIPFCATPNFDKLEKFVTENNIRLRIDRLKEHFAPKIVFIEDDSDEVENDNTEQKE